MHFSFLILAALGTFNNVAFAAPAYGDTASRCMTYFTTKPVPYKTYWSTTTSPCSKTLTKTKTVKTTVPGGVTTVTTTSTVTASTSTLTDTETDTSTATTTTTETSSTTTTIQPTFTPVQSSLAGSSYSGSGGPVNKRDNLLVDVSVGGTSPAYYPKEVKCYHWKHGHCHQSVVTTTTTRTITGGTTTSTATDTTTLYPSATTTTTTTTTTTLTSTTTTTSTATALGTPAPVDCSNPNNYADNVLGVPITGANVDPNRLGGYGPSPSAEDCCMGAMSQPDFNFLTTVFYWLPTPDSRQIQCFFEVATTCPSQGANQDSVTLGTGAQITVGNQMCGEFNSVIGI